MESTSIRGISLNLWNPMSVANPIREICVIREICESFPGAERPPIRGNNVRMASA